MNIKYFTLTQTCSECGYTYRKSFEVDMSSNSHEIRNEFVIKGKKPFREIIEGKIIACPECGICFDKELAQTVKKQKGDNL